MLRGLSALVAALGILSLSHGSALFARAEVQVAQADEDVDKPRRHYRIRRPARLPLAEAQEIYARLLPELKAGYGASGRPAGRDYASWPRYNKAPYLSATHGNLYVNNYANETGAAYGRYEEAGTLPVGSLVAKDSFIVTRDGSVSPGPLFVMEKMPEGFNYVSGDWRYSQINPDGKVVGMTRGAGAERVEYCIACHLAVEQQDHLFFVPDKLRAAP